MAKDQEDAGKAGGQCASEDGGTHLLIRIVHATGSVVFNGVNVLMANVSGLEHGATSGTRGQHLDSIASGQHPERRRRARIEARLNE